MKIFLFYRNSSVTFQGKAKFSQKRLKDVENLSEDPTLTQYYFEKHGFNFITMDHASKLGPIIIIIIIIIIIRNHA
jgi:hypothetical protein